jgi:hypothetical protein
MAPVNRPWRAWSACVLLSVFSACAGVYDPPPPPDECFTGVYTDGRISLRVVHHRGLVAASGWKEPGYDARWEGLDFDGRIVTPGSERHRGEASGSLRVTFPDLSSTEVPDQRLVLAEGPDCAARRDMTLMFLYRFDDARLGESHVLHRREASEP